MYKADRRRSVVSLNETTPLLRSAICVELEVIANENVQCYSVEMLAIKRNLTIL